jgi:MFS family permease
VGLIEGAAEATALIVKVFSGVLSDYLGKRKALAVLGYGLGALSKPLFAVAPGVGTILAARLSDRIGKGIRGAPRDALVADIAPLICAARRSGCGRHSTRLAHSSAR